MVGNQRGIALIITLLVVSLLAITVVEFSYSVEIDQRMARNALNGLQATLLARSGINMGEAFLLHDSELQFDAFTEEWCPLAGPDGKSCRIDETNSQLVIPDNMRLRVQILDESGKVNINMTRPRNPAEWRTWRTWKDKGGNPQAIPLPEAWKGVLVSLGVGEDAADQLLEYWDRLYASQFGDPAQPGVPGATPGAPASPAAPAAQATPVNPAQQANQMAIAASFDLPSLDDASVVSGLTPATVRRLRPVLTALNQARAQRVNVNTAPREVLTAIIGDAGIVDGIVSRRQDGPIKSQELAPLLAGLNTGANANNNNSSRRYAPMMLGVQSSYFLIRASAVVNPDPVSGRGGISRSASMLVRRDPKPGVLPNAPAGTPRWTLTQLDWQKEGGAVLFQSRPDSDLGTDDTTTSMVQDSGW
jgi:type II secretory pathway component PulK